MRIIVKPNNILELNKIKADAFIFGIQDFSIDASTVINIMTLKEIKKDLKDKEIFVSLDKNIFEEELESLETILLDIDKLNLSGILFYDLALLNLKEKLKLKTPLIWNQNYFVTNYRTIDFYKKLGAAGAVIASEITLEEIEKIAFKEQEIKLFINAFGYQMMSFSKRKLVSNYFKFIKEKDFSKEHFLVEKEEKYPIIEEINGTAILSSYVLNYLKEFNTFKNIGIDYLILDEKKIVRKDFLIVVDLFNKAKENNFSNEKINELSLEIDKMFKTSTGFLYKKTIYKVK